MMAFSGTLPALDIWTTVLPSIAAHIFSFFVDGTRDSEWNRTLRLLSAEVSLGIARRTGKRPIERK